jgi:serine/threonine protein phosphatase 1
MIFAVGDIHGRLDLVSAALRRVRAHPGFGAGSRLVFIGDYVDRGPDSRKVVELMMKGTRSSPDRWICLRGNHEQMMIDALAGEAAAMRVWKSTGGVATLQSYRGEVPEAHLDWLKALPRLFETEHHVFVHAGLRPGVALTEQDEAEVLWIREPFLRAGDGFEKHVVHGHTPEWEGKPDPAVPELLAGRTNLDTGAYATGVLTVGVFDARRPGGPVDVMSVTG